MTAKTSFANGINPFHAPPVKPATQPKAKKQPRKPIDLTLLSLCSDPIPEHRRVENKMSKYAPLLKRMHAGECIKCPSNQVTTIVKSIVRVARRHYPNHELRSMSNYGDGMGRVWMLPKPEKLKENSCG